MKDEIIHFKQKKMYIFIKFLKLIHLNNFFIELTILPRRHWSSFKKHRYRQLIKFKVVS